ncbi:hypothetical protein RFM68_32255 [Mesorhizobium sp. MSK_1335]|uniref:Uncharacterized protein n=1 Tax=Mesorhizobium montanum TaxID=3072323 RepID=A0ABU4ZVT4_9HYPH|nr:hypothetical protein [Mesorhizobium sp. MSK_1335]MDX8529135.1 hypothetical protein [Mesorhizobium sp. MSK_1335]
MAKFKEALERGEKGRDQEEEDANAPIVDFGTQGLAKRGRCCIAGSSQIRGGGRDGHRHRHHSAPLGQSVNAFCSVPNLPKARIEEDSQKGIHSQRTAKWGGSVSSPGMVSEEVGNIGDSSDERFRNLIVKLIEDVAKGMC